MNASTDREVTVFWCKVARPHFRTAFDVLLDMLINPLLDPEEVEGAGSHPRRTADDLRQPFLPG